MDSAEYRHRDAFALVVTDHTSRLTSFAFVMTAYPDIAEEVAIALAITSSKPTPNSIISDSKTAINNFPKGRI